MRLRDALRAIRDRRSGRLDLDRADPALNHLLDAVRAPASPTELSGEQAMVAALAAERRRAAAATRPDIPAVPARRSTRRLVVTVVAAVAVLSVSGTAVAARTGNLPTGVQQGAHRLFSGLGVPAPTPSRAPTRTPSSAPAPSPTPRATSPRTPVPLGPAQAGWCAAWQTADAGGHPMNGRDRRDLIAAAGGEENIERYCARQGVTTSPADPTGTTHPGNAPKTKKSKKPRPTHTGGKK
ncbi:hypothetical protein AB0F81_21875 [Actinoplanes sp. NPDC024001]|uniref:hypothetical protein n=1 Tax=Actinoplanes sp. NPDC024001 TaxID=3154598 RepID=UPI00340AC181